MLLLVHDPAPDSSELSDLQDDFGERRVVDVRDVVVLGVLAVRRAGQFVLVAQVLAEVVRVSCGTTNDIRPMTMQAHGRAGFRAHRKRLGSGEHFAW